MDDGFIKMENTKTYTASTSTVTPLLTRPKGVKSFPTTKAFDSFRSGPSHGHAPAIGENGRSYNQKAAAWNTANTILVRRLKGRHLQMIAIGGSIGTFHPIFFSFAHLT
jgi:amino acid transporter